MKNVGRALMISTLPLPFWQRLPRQPSAHPVTPCSWLRNANECIYCTAQVCGVICNSLGFMCTHSAEGLAFTAGGVCMKEPVQDHSPFWDWAGGECWGCVSAVLPLCPWARDFLLQRPVLSSASMPFCLKHLQNEMILNRLHMILKNFRRWKFSHFTPHAPQLPFQEWRNDHIKH